MESDAAVKRAVTLRTEGGKAQQAKLHPKTVMCNLLITTRVSHDYWTVHEKQMQSNNATFAR